MIHLMRHVSHASIGLLAANIIIALNQRLLASKTPCFHFANLLSYNLSINCMYVMTFPLSHSQT